jgi:hypothetical protein
VRHRAQKGALYLGRIGYYCIMKNSSVKINFKQMEVAFRSHVRRKATQAGSSIIYIKDGQLIEENLKDATITIQNKSRS